MRTALAVLAAVALFLLGFAAARARGPEEAPARPARRSEAPRPREEAPSQPPAPVPAAPAPTAELPAALPGRAPQLNDLQNYLASNLAEGKITADQVVAMFRTETDASTLDLLQGVLSANPEAADRPGVVDAFLALARDDASSARRQAAIAFLGSAWDKDGRVRDALFGLARSEGDVAIRMTALGTLPSYSVKNHEQAGAVNAALLEIARTDGNADLRAQAISSVALRGTKEETLRQVAFFLDDPSPSARLASADRLGDAPPEARLAAIEALDRSLARESEPGVKALMLASLVRAGRGGALGALERVIGRDAALRADAQDYLAILRRGVADWDDIAREKADLEGARLK